MLQLSSHHIRHWRSVYNAYESTTSWASCKPGYDATHRWFFGNRLTTLDMNQNLPNLFKNPNKPDPALNNTKTNFGRASFLFFSTEPMTNMSKNRNVSGHKKFSLLSDSVSAPNTKDRHVVTLLYPFNKFWCWCAPRPNSWSKIISFIFYDDARNCTHHRKSKFGSQDLTSVSLNAQPWPNDPQPLPFCPTNSTHDWNGNNYPTPGRGLSVCQIQDRFVLKLSPYKITIASRNPVS